MREKLLKFRLPIGLAGLRRLAIAGLVVAGGAVVAGGFLAENPARALHEIVGGLGGLSWAALVFVIFVSLAKKLWPNFALAGQLLPLRREAGLAAFAFAVGHGAAAAAGDGVPLGDGAALLKFGFADPGLAAGTLAVLVMIPLAVTSGTWAIPRLGPRAWKNLQRAAHLVFVLAGVHIALVESEPGPIFLIAIYAAGYGWLAIRRIRQNR